MQKTQETIQQKAFRLLNEVNTEMGMTETRRDSITTWMYNHGYIMCPCASALRLIDRQTRKEVSA
jgi:GH24 family phage-related lysozyme (muramidase)